MNSLTGKLYFLDPACYLAPFVESPVHFYGKSRFDFKNSLKKALSGGFSGMVFSENFLDHKELPNYTAQTLSAGLVPVFQIQAKSFSSRVSLLKNLAPAGSAGLNISFMDSKEIPADQIKSFPRKFCLFTFVLTKKSKLSLLPQWFEQNTELYCPYKRHFKDPFLTPRQVCKFLKKYSLRPFQGNIYDERVCLDIDLQPRIRPVIKNTSSLKTAPEFSIVIPSYNNKNQIINTLRKLNDQDYPKPDFEAFIVDDGSDDGTLKVLREFIQENKQLNVTVIHFPRAIPRKAGDNRFRAGIARNLGAKYAKGRILAFLDADILTPSHYLRQLKQDHLKADVVQLKRYHLKETANILIPFETSSSSHKEKSQTFKSNRYKDQLCMDSRNLEKNCYIEEKSYWGTFYRKGFENSRPPWKYICTYGLSLLKQDFIDAGGFSNNFICYGFEDTDLGYRLYKRKKKFLLSEIKCFHQAADRGSRRSFLTRNTLLSRSGKIFFYNHLDPEIYKSLTVYMRQKRGLSYFFPKLFHKEQFPLRIA